MARVLYLVTRAEHGGAQTHLVELLEGMRGGFEAHLATGEEGFLTDEARRLGVSVHILPSLVQYLSLREDMLALGETVALIRSLRPSLVHAHSSKAGFLGRLAARVAGVPAVFTAHGWGFAEGVPWRRKMVATIGERLASRWSSGIITVSEADRALALRYHVLPRDRITVVHNGVKDTPERSRPGIADEVRIVMVARFAPPKDQVLLLKALVGQEMPFRLCLVGAGPNQGAACALAGELGLSERVSFVGACSDVNRILGESSLFVLTSIWEGLPISILEAMRAGLPVVASDVGGVREAVVDGETGFLVDRGDLVMLRARLRQLLSDPELRTKMGEAGRKRYLERFTAARMVGETARVYKEVLTQHRLMGVQYRRSDC